MEEDRLKDIFSCYEPKLSSSMDFMERLERNLNAVELIHQQNAQVMKRNRMAVAIASATGFLSGVICTLLYPYIDVLTQTMLTSLLSLCRLPDMLYGIQVLTWLLIGGFSVLIALNTYTISTALLTPHREP